MTTSDENIFQKLGAFAPSSIFLAKAMIRFVEKDQHAKTILEVGAGTGAITKALIGKMHHDQKVDVVEIYPTLSSLLHMRFAAYPSVTIHCTDILQFNSGFHYDLIISSLPLNMFSPELTSAVIERLLQLSNDYAIMSFFEYKILQGWAPIFMNKKKLEQFYQSRALIEEFINQFKFDEAVICLNIPPAVVHYLRIDKSKILLKQSSGLK